MYKNIGKEESDKKIISLLVSKNTEIFNELGIQSDINGSDILFSLL